MQDQRSFAELIALIRAGDQDAYTELYNRYGPFVLREARLRMFNARLRRVFSSEDIAQSVMASFLLRIAGEGNHWEINQPADLINLLVSMTENKVIDKVRLESAEKRGGKVTTQSLESPEALEIKNSRPTPEEIAILKEEAERCWKLFSPEARGLFRMRCEQELSWEEIGGLLGTTGEASRKRLERLLDDVREKANRQSPP